MILIASAASDRLASWEQALEGFGGILAVRQFDALKQGLARVTPQVLVLDLDLPGLDGPRGVVALRKANPTTKIIVLAAIVVDDTEIALFKSGVRGCALRDINPELLKRIVPAIEQGELWIRRSITPRLLDELGARFRDEANATRTGAGRLAVLTQREQEIAGLIGNGESNKQIARQLCITERTVKAHLTGIFRKLGVADRVRLAIRVTQREPEREQAG
jgi:DNA-binding NarL/FixJ family response regulator